MIHQQIFAAAAVLVAGLVSGCAPTPAAGPDPVDGVLTQSLVALDGAAVGNFEDIRVPILKAPAVIAQFGEPAYSVMADGSYIARYRCGGSKYLQIVGTSRPAKPPGYASHGTLPLMGRRVEYYVTGNEDPEFTTKVIRLIAPDGRMANYVVILGGNPGELSAADLDKTMPVLGW